jgi:soluble lytic murein transglycosylase-like protein
MANSSKGKAILFAGLGLGILGFALAVSTPAYASEVWIRSQEKKKGKGRMGNTLKNAAAGFSTEVVASARKWAKTRGVPLAEILATILLESGGNPKAHLLNDKEDSRGLMQVNVRAHGDMLKSRGYSADDLYQIDKGIELGSLVYAQARARIGELVKKCPAPQTHDLGTLTRLYYAGPKYVQSMLQKAKTKEDTAHAFKDSETYVDHWHNAMTAVAEAFGNAAYS